MRDWILAARPKTLPAAVVPVWLGCALAYALEGKFSMWLALCTLLAATLIQVATNFFNDALDFQKGADTEGRIGPARITAGGKAGARRVMEMGCVVMLGAAAFSLPLAAARGWPILVIGIPSLYFSFGYTGGPVPLAYRGLGELFVILFFGLVAVAGTYFVQTGNWPLPPVVLGLQVGALSTVLIAVNNLRDIEEDRSTGKRTLAVRWGESFGRWEIAFLCFVPHVLAFYWPARVMLLPMVVLPLSFCITGIVFSNRPGPVFNKVLAMSALQMVLFAALFHVALS